MTRMRINWQSLSKDQLYSSIVLISILFLTACSTSNTNKTPTVANNIIGSAAIMPTEEPFYAWDFTLTTLSGSEYTLSKMRGDWVIINFWATYCGPCVAEMPALQGLAEKYADCLSVLGINQREEPEDILDFAENNGINFPLLLNPDDQTLANYQVMSLPQTLVVNPSGEIIWRQFGPIELQSFESQLLDLNTGKDLCTLDT